jgi:uncharacterized membrane protein YphA (DoxX/SURF4 family)
MNANTTLNRSSEIPEPNITRFLFADRRMAPVWLVVRVYLGYLWLAAGIGKIMEGGWIGEGAGGAVKGFAGGRCSRQVVSILKLPAGTQDSSRTWSYPVPRCSPTW